MKDLSMRWLLLAAVVLCSISWTSSRRHFGHSISGHKTRHRRQGSKLFLPGSYIIPKGEGHGAWGPWGDPSPCSRTCGGGVAYQARICLDTAPDGRSSCVGGDKKYFSCNIQDCPENSMDFRSEQCAAYDNVPIQDITYNWVPYLNAPNPCELNCMPRGERFYFRHKTKVTDGTLCNSDGLDICVDGTCQPVGCDMLLGSGAREDKCRVCRGNGTSCQTIQAVNTEQFQQGYNDILWIPARATNIYITELRPSFNYLAIRSVREGKYYLNGDYRPQNPQKFEFAGAVWYYERNPYGLAAPDTIRCQGPTTEPVYLSLLLTTDNVGVKYEYSIPNGTLPRPDQRYSWVFDEFTPCSVSCGGGFQTRNVSCASNSEEVSTVDDKLCDPMQRPPSNQSCADVSCPPRWVQGPWGPCSQPCGTGGSQSRQVHCEKLTPHGKTVVSDDECFGMLGQKPELHRRCSDDGGCPKWHTGPWKPCDKLCGSGKESRQVTCFTKRDGRIEKLADQECADEKPPAEQSCLLKPCEGVDWVTSDWKGCDSCLSKARTRTAHCATLQERVDDKFCEHHKMPVLEEQCASVPDCETQWYASEWSKCSTECGKGEQNRLVFCGKLDTKTNKVSVLDDAKCDNETRYNTSQPCVTESDHCPATWHVGPWTACTHKCGTEGLQYRRVICVRGNKTTDNSECDADSLPGTMQECNRVSCNDDDLIPVTAGSTPVYDEDYEEECDEEYPDANADADDDTTTTTVESDVTSTTESDQTLFTEEELMSSDQPYSTSDLLTTGEGSGESTGTTSTGSELTVSTIEGSGEGDLETGSTSSVTGATESTVTDSSTENTAGSDATTESSATSTTDASSDSSVTEATGTAASTTDSVTDSDSTTESSSTDSSTVDASTTDASTTDSSTTDASTTDSSTTDASTTDASTTDSSTTDSSTTDSSTTDISSTDSSTTDGSTADSSTTDDSSTDLSTTDVSSTESSTTNDASTSETLITTDGSTIESSTDQSTTSTGESSTAGSTDTSEESTGTDSSTTEVTATGSTQETGSTDSSTTESTGGSTESSTLSTGETGSTTEGFTGSTETESTQTDSSTTESSWSWASTVQAARKPRKCRPRKSKCVDSQFGCCPDNKTAAAGPFEAGCPIYSTCAETSHGCCPDGVSPAAGPGGRGCPPAHCEQTLFGCCKSDNVTAAEGNDDEGCPPPAPACQSSKFGCCKDGKTEAKGRKGKGCPENAPKPKTCKTSKFGCCHDNVTAATGPKAAGCPCSATEFGCCPDGTSAATGPRMHGCLMACNSSAYGCCQDGETPAHGRLGEGCCLSSVYGCCPDNINSAQGPSFEGCDCRYSPYGCCPDNVTSAHGHDNAGCGCQHSTHGCCPNGHDTATGPDFEGCPCHTHQFGCCPDGVTPATGQQHRGCRCSDTRFGCCGDQVTAASGPDGTGCDCSTSKYGCCPDGKTEATGAKFLGCTDVPKNLQQSCGLEKSPGFGSNYTQRWYFDSEYGGCSRFWYLSQGGNDNRFVTQDECKDVCVSPPGKAACKLPKIKGPCESSLAMWYYDSEREMCGQFTYGGCLGNNNRFSKREECQALCEEPRDSDQCNLPIEAGSCAGNFVRWGYDKDSKRCTQFVWGGCEGNGNRFSTEAACIQKCDAPGTLKDECRLAQDVGNCTEKIPKWRFDQADNRCKPFYFTGCGGNENNYDSERECEERCPKAFVQDTCTLSPEVGDCYDYTLRWFYNVADQRCSQFYWGGCGGNDNNFASEPECLQSCTQRASTTVAPVVSEPFRDEFCFLEADRGECRGVEQRYHYDARTGACQPFNYGGCGGNRNNFPTLEHCTSYCSNVQDACQLPMLVGSCDDSVMQWYYDAGSHSCSQFTYSGCDGNSNRFNSREECEGRCRTAPVATTSTQTPHVDTRFQPDEECRTPASLETCGREVPAWYFDETGGGCTSSMAGACGLPGLYLSEEACERQCGVFRSLPVCEYPRDPGTCRAAIPKIYFDQASGHCLDFAYGGCGGGPNRFSSVEECESVCAAARRPEPEAPAPDERHNQIDDPCEAYAADCARLQCEAGVERRKTADGCAECVCRHPCAALRCREGERCALQPVYSAGGRTFQPVCRLWSKPGACSNITVTEEVQCDRYCNDDADCAADDKCCYRGCSLECRPPQPEERATRPPLYVTTAPPPAYYPDTPAAPQVDESETQSEVASEEGGLATLRCVFNGYPAPTITWQRGALTIDGTTGRYRILTDGALQIISVYRNDSGVYICIGDNPLGQVRKELTLEVRDPVESPANIVGEQNASVTGVLHRSLLLRCSVYGYPPPEVYWFKDKTMLPFESQSYEIDREGLTIRSLEIETLGQYTCQAWNGNGKPASWSVTVRAHRPVGESVWSPWLITRDEELYTSSPPPATQHSTQPEVIDPYIVPSYQQPAPYNVPVHTAISTDRTTFPVGSDLTLPCFVEGLPQPRVYWTKDGVPLEQKDRVHISEANRLTIYKVDTSDSGEYTCQASNDYSAHATTVAVKVEGLYVHPNCTDNPFFANCQLIVKAKYCRHQYYAKFCCRSCTVAGQLSLQDVMSPQMYSDQPRFGTWGK